MYFKDKMPDEKILFLKNKRAIDIYKYILEQVPNAQVYINKDDNEMEIYCFGADKNGFTILIKNNSYNDPQE